MYLKPLKEEGKLFFVLRNSYCSDFPLKKLQLQTLRSFFLGFSMIFFISLLGNAQQLHTESNAASIDNEANEVTGWYSPGSASITSETTSPHHGAYVVKIEASSTTDNDRNARYQFDATIGEIYDISIWTRSGSQSVDPAFAAWSGVSGFNNPTNISTSGSWTEYTFTITATSSTVTLRVYTGSGSQGATGDVLYIDAVSIVAQDDQNPTAPVLTSNEKTDTTVDLSWSGATDNVGVTAYNVYQDGVIVANNLATTSYQATGLSASTSYGFKIRALDAAGNESVDSNEVSVTTNATPVGGSVWTESAGAASYAGNVAIGTSTVPVGYQLAVDGHVRAREIRVDQDVWPDYVFQKGYPLPALEEIQQFILDNGHLPKIPSAKTVEEEGVKLGEMNRLLLEKIEEMTLYVIEQQKQMVGQQQQIDRLQSEINKLKEDFP